MTTITENTQNGQNGQSSQSSQSSQDDQSVGSAGSTSGAVAAPARRIDLMDGAPDFYQAMFALDKAAARGLDPAVRELVRIRVSQLNGCAYCVDKHSGDARALGLSERTVYGVAVWRETPFFTARQRAALALAEDVTRLGTHGVSDAAYDEAAALFDADELPRLIAMCVTMNAWNRIGVTCRMSPAPDAASR